jgi:hypothetical protein
VKTLATAAKAAIVAGEAIVTGAVEINSNRLFTLDTNVWRYKREAYNSTNTYEAEAYDDSAWSTGVLPFGSEPWAQPGDSGFRTIPANPYLTQECVHLRRVMTLAAPIAGLQLSAFVDNGWTLWVNGVEVFTDYGTFGHTNSQFVAGSYFRVGSNTIYIKVVDDAAHTIGVDKAYFDMGVTTDVAGTGGALRVWGGYGPITIGGEVYQGIGDRGFAQQTAGAIGGVAQGLTLTLSAIEPNLLALFDDAADFKGASVVIYRLIFGPAGKTLLDAHVFDRGRIDTIASEETPGGAAAIVVAVESAARGLGRAGARMRADGDQRLIASTDGYFKNCAYAPQKELFWGGKKPSIAATAVGG